MMRKGRERDSAAKAGPPDPATVRSQRQSDEAAAQQRLARFIASQVLPWVNRALRSPDHLRHEVGDLMVSGSRRQVEVSGHTVSIAWARQLVRVLSEPPYNGYTVKFKGSYPVPGQHPASYRTVDLDVRSSALEFIRAHPQGSFIVEISL